MDEKNEYGERLPIMQWPELERKIGIIARMTSDPPPKQRQNKTLEQSEEIVPLLAFSENLAQREREISRG
jgi:hypothetical protein